MAIYIPGEDDFVSNADSITLQSILCQQKSGSPYALEIEQELRRRRQTVDMSRAMRAELPAA